MSSFVIQRMFGLSAARMGEIEAGTRQNNATRILKVDFKNDRALAFGVGLMAGNLTRKSAQRSRGQTPCSFSCKATLATESHPARERVDPSILPLERHASSCLDRKARNSTCELK